MFNGSLKKSNNIILYIITLHLINNIRHDFSNFESLARVLTLITEDGKAFDYMTYTF